MSRYPRRSKKIFRSTNDKVIAGVCAGFADYFCVAPIWIRLAMVAGCTILAHAHVLIPLYIICVFLLPTGPSSRKAAHPNSNKQEPSDIPQDYLWNNAPKEERMSILRDEFSTVERKVRNLEDYVTSKEFQLNRKFEAL